MLFNITYTGITGMVIKKGIIMINERPNIAPNSKYTVMEACRALGIHRNTLNRYLKAGFVACCYSKVGNKKIFMGDELLKLWQHV